MPWLETAIREIGALKAGRTEAIVIPTQVNHVCLGGRFYPEGAKFSPVDDVVQRAVNNGHLCDTVRHLGGAYAPSLSMDGSVGSINFSSNQDPNIFSTLEAFQKTTDWLQRQKDEKTPIELERLLIGALGGWDRPDSASRKGVTALWGHVRGHTKEEKDAYRAGLFEFSNQSFADFGDRLAAALPDLSRAIATSRSGADSVKKEFPDATEIVVVPSI